MKRLLFTVAAIALTTVPAIALKTDFVQAQPNCPNQKFVPPSQQTRVYRHPRGFSFKMPANYRAMAIKDGIDVLDPSAFEWTQCIIRNREATELKLAPVSVNVTAVNPGRRNLEALVKAQYPWVKARFSPTRVSNQAAITASYNDTLEGNLIKDVYVLTPNRRYLIRVSGPAQGELLKLALSSFAFK